LEGDIEEDSKEEIRKDRSKSLMKEAPKPKPGFNSGEKNPE
jgi:hypothetical protein